MAIANLPKLNFSVPFAMTAALPVEYNAYFSTLADATAAAAQAEAPGSSNTVYYFGQKIVVVGDTECKLYIIQPDKTLKEAGGVPLGDGASITVGEDGKIAVKGVAEASANQQPRIKIVDGAKTIEWYTPDNSTVAGLQQTVGQHTTEIDGLKTRMDTAESDIDTNTTNIETNTSDITKITDGTTVVGKASKDAEGNVINTTYATKTALTDGLAAKANSTDVYKKTETYSQTEVDDKVAAAVSSVYKPAGSSAFATLPEPVKAILGNVYNINDAFTTDDKFVEGTGKKYPAGTNVVVVKVSTDYKYDVLAGMTDLTDYYTKKQVDDAIDADVKVVTDGLDNGTIVAAKATSATNDGDGKKISDTYATKTDLGEVSTSVSNIISGTTTVGKAQKDGDGNIISDTYATTRQLEDSIADVDKTLIVTFTKTGSDWSADKTLNVVKEAISAGKHVVGKIGSINAEIELCEADASSVSFMSTEEITEENGVITFAQTKINYTAGNVISVDAIGKTAYSKDTLDTKLSGKVDTVSGKQLSTNDFTNALKDKLDAIPAGAQVNAIDTVSDEFTLSDTKELSVNAIDKSKITGLSTALDSKLENVKVAGATANLPVSGKTVTLPGATASALGLVKGSTANNGVSINADFTMTVNNITTDKLVQGTDTLIWNGGSAASAG